MATVTRLAHPTDFSALTTTLLDNAAAIEHVVHDHKRQIQALTRDLRRAHEREARTRRWIVALRQSHRTASHAKTAGLFKRVLADLEANAASAPLTLFPDSLAV